MTGEAGLQWERGPGLWAQGVRLKDKALLRTVRRMFQDWDWDVVSRGAWPGKEGISGALGERK